MFAALSPAARARRRGQRGAVAVEAALVTSFILVPMLLGIIEFCFVMRDYVAVTSASRSGARMASASAAAGVQVCDTGESGTDCSNTSAPQLAKVAVNAIQDQGTALNKDQVNYVLVYKANASGFPGTLTKWGSNPITDCKNAGSCVTYTWVKGSGKFKYSSGNGSWTSTTINACVANTDAVGVYINTTHRFVSNFFGATLPVSDRTVMSFEPLTAATCAAGTHA